MTEQLDRPATGKKSITKTELKRMKHKEERAQVKQQIHRGEEVTTSYGKYRGWEW